MNRNLMSLAVASALAAAGSASALTPAQIAALPGGAAGLSEVRMSGATAQDPGITGVVQRLCTSGSLDAYVSGTTTAYVCAAGAPVSKNIIIQKESAAGSANGIGPVRDGTTLTYVDVTLVNTTNCGTAGTPVASTAPVAPDTLGLPGYTKWTCGAITKAAVPDIGFADVDPAIFGQSTTGLQQASPNQLMFGVPVTVALRNALQTAQGLTSGSETSANVPSLTSTQLAGVYSGNISTVDGLGVGTTATSVWMVRRVNTSGSEKAAELFFLNQGVNPSSQPMTMALISFGDTGSSTATSCGTATSAPAVGYVMGGNGTGDVLNCLNAHNSGGRYAVGLASMEKNQFAPGAGWRYVRVDGVLPTIANAIRGIYNYWTEQVMLSKTTIAGDVLTVWNHYKNNLGTSPIMAILNQSFSVFNDTNMGGAGGGQPAGQQTTGLMAPPAILIGGACPAKYAGSVTPDNDPIDVSTKSVTGAPDNRVKPPVAVCPPRF